MLTDYRYLQIIAVQSGAETYSHHRFKRLGAYNLCLLSKGALVHRLFT